jgi:hypothetical protein
MTPVVARRVSQNRCLRARIKMVVVQFSILIVQEATEGDLNFDPVLVTLRDPVIGNRSEQHVQATCKREKLKSD